MAENTLLVRHADVLVTMDAGRREIRDGGVFIRGNRIEQVGQSSELPQHADQIFDLSGHVVLPGLVNCHHHLYQTLTRTIGTDVPVSAEATSGYALPLSPPISL